LSGIEGAIFKLVIYRVKMKKEQKKSIYTYLYNHLVNFSANSAGISALFELHLELLMIVKLEALDWR
jgi:hypothetical protein